MIFSTTDIQNRIEEMERDYFELVGHMFVRECIDLYIQGQLPNVRNYDITAIEFLRDDNIDHMKQMLDALYTNMRVLNCFAHSMAHKISHNKPICIVDCLQSPKCNSDK